MFWLQSKHFQYLFVSGKHSVELKKIYCINYFNKKQQIKIMDDLLFINWFKLLQKLNMFKIFCKFNYEYIYDKIIYKDKPTKNIFVYPKIKILKVFYQNVWILTKWFDRV